MATRAASALRPTRDAPTWISYVEIALIAFFVMGYGSTLALLRDEQGTTRTVVGLHATVLAFAGVLAAALVPRMVDRWGRSRLIRMSMALLAVGVALYTVPAGLVATLPGVALVGMGFTSALVCLNAFLLDYQRGAGPAALTQANALAALAGLISPLVVGIGAATILGWRAGLWVLVIAIVVAEVIRACMGSVFGSVQPRSEVRESWRGMPPSFWWSCLMVGCLSAVEVGTFTWTADLLREQAGLAPAAAAAGLGAVSAGMVLGRFIGGRLAQTYSVDGLLRHAIIIAGVALLLAWLARTPALLLGCLFLVGLGISVNWPLGVARVVAASGGQANRGASLASVAGGIAGGTFPFLVGALADRVGIQAAFLTMPAVLVVALVILRAVPVAPFEGAGSDPGD